MAVNAISSTQQPSISFVMPSSTRTISSVAVGFYSVSYTPTTASLSIITPDASQTVTGGNGLFVNTSTQPVTFITSFTGVQVILYATDVDVVTTTSNTVEVITASGTYTNTGNARVCAIGGGNGGAGAFIRQGGNGGGVAGGTVSLPGSVPVTIGSGGSANPYGWQGQSAGGNTIFGSITAPGGGGGAGSGIPLVPGTPGESSIAPTGFLTYFGIPGVAGGASTNFPGPPHIATGGQIAAGGGYGAGGGGGGGGGVAGSNTGPGGGAGGAGRVFIIRY